MIKQVFLIIFISLTYTPSFGAGFFDWLCAKFRAQVTDYRIQHFNGLLEVPPGLVIRLPTKLGVPYEQYTKSISEADENKKQAFSIVKNNSKNSQGNFQEIVVLIFKFKNGEEKFVVATSNQIDSVTAGDQLKAMVKDGIFNFIHQNKGALDHVIHVHPHTDTETMRKLTGKDVNVLINSQDYSTYQMYASSLEALNGAPVLFTGVVLPLCRSCMQDIYLEAAVKAVPDQVKKAKGWADLQEFVDNFFRN